MDRVASKRDRYNVSLIFFQNIEHTIRAFFSHLLLVSTPLCWVKAFMSHAHTHQLPLREEKKGVTFTDNFQVTGQVSHFRAANYNGHIEKKTAM